MKIELQRMVDGIWYIYGKYDMSKTHDAIAFGEAVSELAKHFNIRTVVSYSDVEKQVEGFENKIADVKANCDLAIEGRDIKIQELEKENKELKSELTKKADTNHSLVEQMAKLESNFRICEKNADTYYDQLTKAKEHINKLLCLLDDFAEDEIDSGGRDFMEQARQFLKEIEK